jgi:hypothetical protein
VEFDIENREEFFPHLLCSLDLKRIPREVLEREIENYPLVVKDESCKAHVMNVKMKYITGMTDEDSGTMEAILVAGGFVEECIVYPQFSNIQSFAMKSVFAYILAEDRWIRCAPLPCVMKKASVAFCSKKNC